MLGSAKITGSEPSRRAPLSDRAERIQKTDRTHKLLSSVSKIRYNYTKWLKVLIIVAVPLCTKG